VETAWLAFPLTVTEEAPFDRIDLIKFLWDAGIEVRSFFSGNILGHPAFDGVWARASVDDLPNADRIMRSSLRIGCHQAIGPSEVAHVRETVTTFLIGF